jgi:hypothetical protein
VAQSTVQQREQAGIPGRLHALRLLLDTRRQALVQWRAPAHRVPLLLRLTRDLERPAGHPNRAAATRTVALRATARPAGQPHCARHVVGFGRFARASGVLDVSHGLLASLLLA